MKKIVSLIVLILLSIHFVDARDVITRDVSQLPAKARETVANYFSDASISYIKVDREGWGNKVYKVVLTDGKEIEFDAKGDWKEIDCKKREVPEAFILSPIRQYINNNFPTNYVEKIDKERKGYKVELNNDLELYFDLNGQFLKMDD